MDTNQQDGGTHSEQQRVYVIESVAVKRGVLPDARGGATLTQTANGFVYLIGGANREAKCFGDVCRFDLAKSEWMQIEPATGSFDARSGHAAVAVGDSIYVVGGMNPFECVVYDDVQIFDTITKAWRQPLVEGWMPSARNAHAMIRLPSDAEHHRILMYGGSSPEEGAFGDVYVLHIPIDDVEAPLRWEHRECAGPETPEPRELHVASFLTPTSILFSGGRNRDGTVCTDMAVLDIEKWEWQLIPICEWNRCSHVAGNVGGAIVSFGGFDGGAIRDDCWEYADDAETWLRVEPGARTKDKDSGEPETHETAVPGRFGHCGCSVTVSDGTKALMVFGGMNADADLNDLVLITATTA